MLLLFFNRQPVIVLKTLVGETTSVGIMTKAVGIPFSGFSVPTGFLSEAKARIMTLIGELSFSGAQITSLLKNMGGVIQPTGLITKSYTTTKTGTILPFGTFSRISEVIMNFVGSIVPTGLLLKQYIVTKVGETTFSGTLSGFKAKIMSFAGEIIPSGTFSKLLNIVRTFSGLITPTGIFASPLIQQIFDRIFFTLNIILTTSKELSIISRIISSLEIYLQVIRTGIHNTRISFNEIITQDIKRTASIFNMKTITMKIERVANSIVKFIRR